MMTQDTKRAGVFAQFAERLGLLRAPATTAKPYASPITPSTAEILILEGIAALPKSTVPAVLGNVMAAIFQREAEAACERAARVAAERYRGQ